MEYKEKNIILGKMFFQIAIFIFALLYENASIQRIFIISAIFVMYLSLSFFKTKFKNQICIYVLVILEIALIFYLELNSRFVINYFLHIFYLLALIEICYSSGIKLAVAFSSIILLVSSYKFIYLMIKKPGYSSTTQLLFSNLLIIFITAITLMLKFNIAEKKESHRLYKELLKSHENEKKYREQAIEFSAMNERQKIARDLHDSLGHMLTGQIMRLEMIKMEIRKSNSSSCLVNEAIRNNREGLKTVREIVDTLKNNEEKSYGLDSIENMIIKFASETQVNIESEFNISNISPVISATLYRVIQESLTNAVRHGKAKEIRIKIKESKNLVMFEIEDNGVGCISIEKGNGLKGIQERVKQLDGDVSFKCKENGFIIKGRIPIMKLMA